jgi:hypothetical protein
LGLVLDGTGPNLLWVQYKHSTIYDEAGTERIEAVIEAELATEMKTPQEKA